MAKLVVLLMGALVLLAVGCGGQAGPSGATTLSEGEVIGLVQSFTMGQVVGHGTRTCYQTLRDHPSRGWDGAAASYTGNGRWLVTLDNRDAGSQVDGMYEWEVYEKTLTVRGLKEYC